MVYSQLLISYSYYVSSVSSHMVQRQYRLFYIALISPESACFSVFFSVKVMQHSAAGTATWVAYSWAQHTSNGTELAKCQRMSGLNRYVLGLIRHREWIMFLLSVQHKLCGRGRSGHNDSEMWTAMPGVGGSTELLLLSVRGEDLQDRNSPCCCRYLLLHWLPGETAELHRAELSGSVCSSGSAAPETPRMRQNNH